MIILLVIIGDGKSLARWTEQHSSHLSPFDNGRIQEKKMGAFLTRFTCGKFIH